MKSDLVFKLQDYRRLDWNDRSRSSLGTPGCFLKTYEHDGAERIYYKLSNFDSYTGFFGHESVNELIASRLLDLLEIEHVPYTLIHAWISVEGKDYQTWMCASPNFKAAGEQKIALDSFYDIRKNDGESPVAFCERMGWHDYLSRMLLVDYLICNRDRHGANIEVLYKNDEKARLAPLFDHGLSLLFSCYGEENEIRSFDVMKDRPTNNYLYSRFPKRNLAFVDRSVPIRSLKESDRDTLFDGLDKVLPDYHLEKIWEMIWNRWQHYENL